MTNQMPATLLFDGECGICREWVRYWQQLTGNKIIYRPYQEAVPDYPNIPVEDLKAAIHLIDPDGNVTKGARATYGLYSDIHPYSILLYLYRYLPGFGILSEIFYNVFSKHRGILAFITHLFWGRDFKPPQFQLISWLYLRLLGLVYLVAFVSFFVQADALIGSNGVLPLEYYLNAVKDQVGISAYWKLPTLFWVSCSDTLIKFVCLAGIFFSVCLVLNRLKIFSLILLYISYLSLVSGGQIFMSFQWDMLLLECGFLAIFLPWGSRIIIWLYRWLIFRFMFLGGAVKIVSNDPSWDSLTALNYHFETQPLPTPLAWYAHHLPESIHVAATGLTLIIELLLPFFIFTPRRFRHVAASCFILFQSTILLTGNYNFFNLLTIFTCLFLFDDAAIQKFFPQRLLSLATNTVINRVGLFATSCACLIAATSLYMGSVQINWVVNRDRNKDTQFSQFYRLLNPFGITNSYGPFAVMTQKRYEIVLEGSADNKTWQEYHFKYKPDDLDECPGWVEPHQPRIDWQMWFAALSRPEQQRWLLNLMVRLLQNSEPVTAIFAENPFPEGAPVHMRALFYRYTFTSYEERSNSGHCWKRELVGEYIPSVGIKKTD